MNEDLRIFGVLLLAFIVGTTIVLVPIVAMDHSAHQTMAMMYSTLVGPLAAAMVALKLMPDRPDSNQRPPGGRKPLPVVLFSYLNKKAKHGSAFFFA